MGAGAVPLPLASAKIIHRWLWPFEADSVIERAISNDPTLPASLSRGFFGVRSGRARIGPLRQRHRPLRAGVADTSPAKAGEEGREVRTPTTIGFANGPPPQRVGEV